MAGRFGREKAKKKEGRMANNSCMSSKGEEKRGENSGLNVEYDYVYF